MRNKDKTVQIPYRNTNTAAYEQDNSNSEREHEDYETDEEEDDINFVGLTYELLINMIYKLAPEGIMPMANSRHKKRMITITIVLVLLKTSNQKERGGDGTLKYDTNIAGVTDI